MKNPIEVGVFKPSPSRNESKSDNTNKVARQIIASDAAATTAKTMRLRAERLARDVAESTAFPAKK